LAQRFNSAGATIGGEFFVADSTNSEEDPDVAMAPNGNFVVSYTDDFSSTDRDVLARRFSSTGAFLGTVDVARSGSADETRSSVAINGSGQFDVAYQFTAHGSSQSDVRVGLFDAQGHPIFDQGVATTSFDETEPSISMDNFGSAVVAYTKFVGNDFDIKARRVNGNGVLIGSEINIRSTLQDELDAAVAVERDGGAFVVTYSEDGPKSFGQSVTEVSSVDTILSNTDFDSLTVSGSLSIDAKNNYLLTFTDLAGSDADIHMRVGHLPNAPAAQNLTLTSPIKVGHFATLSGQLVDADGDTNLTLTVNWGDGSKVQHSKPGTKPFALKHKYAHAGTYTVHATWTDSTGLSNSRDLSLVVTSSHVSARSRVAVRHRA
jgi:PKD domain